MECCLGEEKLPEEYVGHLVLIFRELRRILRDDGLLWLNLGDNYAAGGRGGGGHFMQKRGGRGWNDRNMLRGWQSPPPGLQAKNICGMPYRVALALQADGWLWRGYPSWVKPNGMPDSASDRPGANTEAILLFAKSQKYFYDRVAIMKSASGNAHSRGKGLTPKSVQQSGHIKANQSFHASCSKLIGMRNRRFGDWFMESLDAMIDQQRAYLLYLEAIQENRGCVLDSEGEPLGIVVQIQGTSDAHFATFPRELVRPMILASTSEVGCCPECRAPYLRVTDSFRVPDLHAEWANTNVQSSVRRLKRNEKAWREFGASHKNPFPMARTIGWQATCTCGAWNPVPCLVLDIFSGRGTTAVTARDLGRSYLGLELNPEYVLMSENWLKDGEEKGQLRLFRKPIGMHRCEVAYDRSN